MTRSVVWLAPLLIGPLAGCSSDGPSRVEMSDLEVKLTAPRWVETEVKLPTAPADADLLPFTVESPGQTHNYHVDGRSLRVDSDGVVRYTVVIRSAGGARNVSFEGIRCETGERRIYAYGRPSGQWAEVRASKWDRIRFGSVNEYQATLYLEHFCRGGVPVRNVAAALRSLRDGADRSKTSNAP